MSSDLSFLIQNENQVEVDKSFLEKYQKQPTKIEKALFKNKEQSELPRKEIKLKKKMTEIQSRKKKFPIKSYTSQHFPAFQGKTQIVNPQQRNSFENNSKSAARENQKYFERVEQKIAELLKNQASIQQQISSNFFNLKQTIQASQKSDKGLCSMVQKTKLDIRKTKSGIGQILSLIQTHKTDQRSGHQYNLVRM